jgi:predicted thioesterase
MSDSEQGPGYSGPEGPLEAGLTFQWSRVVTNDLSARHLGSGDVGVLATPAMIAMMEGASLRCVQPHLDDGLTTVGYIVNVRHLAPTPIGAEVTVSSRLDEIDGRRLKFRVEAHEGDKLVGEGEHVRVVVDPTTFLQQSTA